MNATNLASALAPTPAPQRNRPAPASLALNQTLGAIEIGPDAVRLKIVRMTAVGTLETVHQQTAPGLPGSGVDEEPVFGQRTTRFLLATLRGYADLCRAHGALLRAVATSAFRRACDCDDIVSLGRTEAGIDIELISNREEAYLLALAVLGGAPERFRSFLIDVGADAAQVILTAGEQPIAFWELGLDMKQSAAALVRASDADRPALLTALRTRARHVVSRARLGSSPRRVDSVIAIAGTDLTVPGAIMLDAILDYINVGRGGVEAADKRLGDGVIDDLARTCRNANRDARPLTRGSSRRPCA